MTVRDTEEQEKRRQHIEELMEKLELIAGERVLTGFSPDCPDVIKELFLERVVAYETAAKNQEPLIDVLTKSGLQLPPPKEMDEAGLSVKLWEVIRAMALFGAYLHNTDHLSDRELYLYLWNEVLREPVILMPERDDYSIHHDAADCQTDEGARVFLEYYADEATRREWVRECPGYKMPPRRKPSYDRDRHLPVAPDEESQICPDPLAYAAMRQ